MLRRSSTTRNLDREIRRLALPALGALVAEPLYILADTAVVGRLGTPQLAGLAVASSLLLLAHSLFIFLAYGTTSTVARLLGAGEHDRAAHHAVQSLWLAAAIGVAAALAAFPAAPMLTSALGAEGAVQGHAITYLRVSLAGIPAMLLVLAGTGYLRGRQDTATPLRVALASAAANLAIEVVLVFGLDHGIGASALATVVAQWGAAAVYLWRIHAAVSEHAVALRPDLTVLRRLARTGRDLFLRTVALRAVLVTTTALAARLGPTTLAGHQIAFEIWSALALVLDSFAIAGQAMIGHRLGSGDAASAAAASRRLVQLGAGFGVAMGTVVGIAHGALPHAFTSDAAVVERATLVLVFVGLLQPLNGIVFVLDGILIGAGDERRLATAMATSASVFALVAIVATAADAGLPGLWSAIGAFMAARFVTLGLRWRSGAWTVTGASSPGQLQF